MTETKNTYHYSGAAKKDIDGRNATEHRLVLRLVKLLDVIGVAIPFILAWNLYYPKELRAINSCVFYWQ